MDILDWGKDEDEELQDLDEEEPYGGYQNFTSLMTEFSSPQMQYAEPESNFSNAPLRDYLDTNAFFATSFRTVKEEPTFNTSYPPNFYQEMPPQYYSNQQQPQMQQTLQLQQTALNLKSPATSHTQPQPPSTRWVLFKSL
jgi:hypothetical protein